MSESPGSPDRRGRGEKSDVSFCGKLGIAWSCSRTWRRLRKPPVKRPRFPILDLYRSLAMIWVHILHVNYYPSGFETFSVPSDQRPAIRESWPKQTIKWYMLPISSGSSGVDVFFAISGFLMFHLLWSELIAYRRLQLMRFYIRRCIRIIPALMVAVLVSHFAYSQFAHCKSEWLPILLSVYNFEYQGKHRCVAQAWSVSVEMQLYLLSPLLVLFVWAHYDGVGIGGKRIWIAIAKFSSLLGLGVLCRLWYLLHYKMYSHAFYKNATEADTEVAIRGLYTYPFTRMLPFVCGCIAAFLYHDLLIDQQDRRRFDQETALLTPSATDDEDEAMGNAQPEPEPVPDHMIDDQRKLLPLAYWTRNDERWGYLVCVFLAVAGMFYDMRLTAMTFGEKDVPSWIIGFLILFSRLFIGISTAYLLFMGMCERGAFVQNLAQWNGWYIIAQLSYSAYLLQFVVYRFVFQWLPVSTPTELQPQYTLFRALVGFPLTLLLSLAVFLAIEAPLLRIHSIFWPIASTPPKHH